jgi:hypothetical protein
MRRLDQPGEIAAFYCVIRYKGAQKLDRQGREVSLLSFGHEVTPVISATTATVASIVA